MAKDDVIEMEGKVLSYSMMYRPFSISKRVASKQIYLN